MVIFKDLFGAHLFTKKTDKNLNISFYIETAVHLINKAYQYILLKVINMPAYEIKWFL